MKRVTINDIARECKTSKATVSYVINERYNKVSKQMVERVQKAIKDLGYVPSLNAKSLAGRGSNLIGVIIPQMDVGEKLIFDNPFYSEFLSGLEYYLRKSGYGVVLSVINRENCFEEMVKKWNLDGAVVFGIDNDEMLHMLGEFKFAVLLIDSYITSSDYYRMNIRDEEACYEATKLLIGTEKDGPVALVTGQIAQSRLLQERMSGYRRALEENGYVFDEKLVYQGDITFEYGVEAADKILKRQGVTKILATADILARGVLNKLQNEGKQVPSEYSVMGFDDTYQSRNMYPRLTTVGQNILERGERAGQLILKTINHEFVEKENFMDFRIIERDTTK